MESKAEKKLSAIENKIVKLVWDKEAELSTVYANNLIISHSGSEFYLVFGEMEPWLELDPSITPIELQIKPIAKIAISHENMLKFAEVILGNVKKYKDVSSRKDDA